MNNVEVGHCCSFSSAKGHLYVTLRSQELPIMISSYNDHDIEGDDIENCKSDMSEQQPQIQLSMVLLGEASKKIYLTFF